MFIMAGHIRAAMLEGARHIFAYRVLVAADRDATLVGQLLLSAEVFFGVLRLGKDPPWWHAKHLHNAHLRSYNT